MSNFKSEVLPSGVLIRKIKDDDNNYVLTCQGQAIIVSKMDIARMDGIVYPTRRLSEKCCNVAPKPEEPVNVEKAWHNVSHKFLESTTNNCIACTIQERDEQVKQMPRHTCGIDGPNGNSAECLKAEYKPIEQETDAYEVEVRRIAEVLARIHYANAITSLYPAETWEGNPVSAKEWAISNKMDEARAMVSEICSALKKSMWDVAAYEMIPSIFDEGYMSVEQFREELKEHGLSDKYLIERGLIPAQESTTCPHVHRSNTSDTTAKCLDCGLTYVGQWYNSPSNQ